MFREILSDVFSKLFSNIGGKIKTLAKVICLVGMVISLIQAVRVLNMGYEYQNTAFASLLTLGLGCLFSWIGSFFTYGFGELIDRTCSIDDKLSSGSEKEDSGSGIPAADSWICPDCGTVNPKSKIECHECGRLRI